MRLALKVDVDTLRGTREGVPALLRLFDRFGVRATFLFSLGPDHTGRAIKRVFKPGFLSKVGRTSVVEHYGIKTLLYGTLLPGPHIGKRCASIMRDVAAAGHETGIHTYDHIRWQDYVAQQDRRWTEIEMNKAADMFQFIFNKKPHTHGAAGWQMNSYAFAWEQAQGMQYASDCRGQSPFLPVIDGQSLTCPQLPTTLPTLDELIGCDDLTVDNVHQRVIADSQQSTCGSHVYTLHAELEGMKLLPIMTRLLEAWRSDGFQLGATADLYATLNKTKLPRHYIEYGSIPGRSGTMALQGAPL